MVMDLSQDPPKIDGIFKAPVVLKCGNARSMLINTPSGVKAMRYHAEAGYNLIDGFRLFEGNLEEEILAEFAYVEAHRA